MLFNKVININSPNFVNFIKSLVLLMKPRVMSLVVFTSAVGLLTAPNTIPLFNSLMGNNWFPSNINKGFDDTYYKYAKKLIFLFFFGTFFRTI